MSRLPILVALVAGCGRLGFGNGDATHGDGGGGGGGESGSNDGGGAGADALQIAGCGSTTILSDDFEDGVVGSPWTVINTTGGYAVTEMGGHVSVAYPGNAPVNSRGAYRQTASQSLVGTCAIAEVTMVPTGAMTAYAYLRFGGPMKYIEIAVENGHVVGRFNNNGSTGTNGNAVYDAGAHRFLRIRQSGGNYALEVGPSLTSFTTLGSIGGVAVDPSPTSLEIGGSVETVAANGGAVVQIERVIFLGP